LTWTAEPTIQQRKFGGRPTQKPGPVSVIAAGEGCTTWGDVAAVLNDVEHAVEKLRVVITALIAEQHNSNT
jgi:hypothetical protein